jgi:hypothetical protein
MNRCQCDVAEIFTTVELSDNSGDEYYVALAKLCAISIVHVYLLQVE